MGGLDPIESDNDEDELNPVPLRTSREKKGGDIFVDDMQFEEGDQKKYHS